MGLPPFLVVAATNGIVAQRLVRRLCRNCQGEGCTCNRTGFKGRLAVHEVCDLYRYTAPGGAGRHERQQTAQAGPGRGHGDHDEDGMEKVKMGLTREEVVGSLAWTMYKDIR